MRNGWLGRLRKVEERLIGGEKKKAKKSRKERVKTGRFCLLEYFVKKGSREESLEVEEKPACLVSVSVEGKRRD